MTPPDPRYKPSALSILTINGPGGKSCQNESWQCQQDDNLIHDTSRRVICSGQVRSRFYGLCALGLGAAIVNACACLPCFILYIVRWSFYLVLACLVRYRASLGRVACFSYTVSPV